MFKRDLNLEISEPVLIDISAVKNVITNRINEKIDVDVNNDRNKFSTHSKTKSHLIYDFPLEWDGLSDIEATLFSGDQELIDSVEPLVNHLEEHYNGKRGRVLLVNLPAGASIPEHRDSGVYLQTVKRNHIPIITNDLVSFAVGDTEINMKEGYFYEINNHKTHQVKNNSEYDRYHLIVDILPKHKTGYDIEVEDGPSKDI